MLRLHRHLRVRWTIESGRQERHVGAGRLCRSVEVEVPSNANRRGVIVRARSRELHGRDDAEHVVGAVVRRHVVQIPIGFRLAGAEQRARARAWEAVVADVMLVGANRTRGRRKPAPGRGAIGEAIRVEQVSLVQVLEIVEVVLADVVVIDHDEPAAGISGLEELHPRPGNRRSRSGAQGHRAAFVHRHRRRCGDGRGVRGTLRPEHVEVPPFAHLHARTAVAAFRSIVVVLGGVEQQLARRRDVEARGGLEAREPRAIEHVVADPDALAGRMRDQVLRRFVGQLNRAGVEADLVEIDVVIGIKPSTVKPDPLAPARYRVPARLPSRMKCSV